MPKGLWIRNGALAVPMDDRSRDFLFSIKEGMPFIADTHGARNPKQLRLWWALCTIVAEHFDVLPETISDDVKIAVGHSQVVKQRDGTPKIRPKSIAEESMPQELFNSLLTLAIDKMSEWMAVAPDELRRRFEEVSADRRYEGLRR